MMAMAFVVAFIAAMCVCALMFTAHGGVPVPTATAPVELEQEAQMMHQAVSVGTFAPYHAEDGAENDAWNDRMPLMAHEQYAGADVRTLARKYNERFPSTWVYTLQTSLGEQRSATRALQKMVSTLHRGVTHRAPHFRMQHMEPVSFVRAGLYGATFLVRQGDAVMVLKWMPARECKENADPWNTSRLPLLDHPASDESLLKQMQRAHVQPGHDSRVKCLVFSNWFMHVLCTALTNHLVLQRATPCFLLHYEAHYDEDADAFYACMEQMDGAFRDESFFRTYLDRGVEPEDVDTVLFFVCHALATAYDKFRLQHHDMHTGNILLQMVPKLHDGDEHFAFTHRKRHYRVPNRGFLAKVADWDIAHIHLDPTHSVCSNHQHVLQPRTMCASFRMLARKMRKKSHTRGSGCLNELERLLEQQHDIHPSALFHRVFKKYHTTEARAADRSPYLHATT